MINVLINDNGRHLKDPYGYARVSKSLIEGFSKTNGITLYVCIESNFISNINIKKNQTYNYININDIRKIDFSYCIQVCPPNLFKPLIKNTFLYSMVDTINVPSIFLKNLENATGIITPSSTSKNAFQKFFNNVYKLPLPLVNDQIFKKRLKYRKEGPDKFGFIYVGTDGFRKGVDTLINSFVKEFDRGEARLTLIMTEKPASIDKIYRRIIGTLNRNNKLADINLITKPLSDSWLSRIYCQHDCYVSFSRGEGWGYPNMEAAQCGLPVICPNGLSSWDFLEESFNFKCPSTQKYISEIEDVDASDFKKKFGDNRNMIISTKEVDAKKILRAVFFQHKNLNRLGDLSSQIIKKNFNHEEFVKKIKVLNDLILKQLVK